MTGVPRAICSAIRATLRSRSSTFVTARSTMNAPDRLTLGSTPRRRCRRAWWISLTISPADRMSPRASPYGLAMNAA